MTRALSVATFVVALSVSSLAVQEKPNFAGTWKLTSDAAGDLFTSPELVVAQDAKTLVITTAGQMGEIKTTYNLDGTEANSPIEIGGNSIARTTKLTWEGAKLVLVAKADFGGQPFEIKTAWSLDGTGTLLVESTRPDFQGGGGPVTTKAAYKK